MFSQSRDGPGFSTLEAMISTVAPDFSAESSGHQASVDAGPDAGVAHLGVDGVGEVQRCGTVGEDDHVALRGEDVDLVVLEVALEVGHELGRVRGLGLPVQDLVQPDDVVGGRLLLVGPVGGHAQLGPLVHLLGADLELDRLAARAHDRGVQRLVEVELGQGDVVLEPARHRLPHAVDAAQGGVAVLHRGHDHPDADEVEDVVEGAAADHLLVDAPEVLRAAGDVGLDPHLRQALGDLALHLGEVEVPLGGPGVDQVVDLGEALRVQGGESEVLQLLLDLLDAEAVGQRGVDVEGLLGDAQLLLGRHGGQGAHVVQAVGQLDHEDPQVVGHGHEHLAHGGRLLGLAGLELQALQLGDPVDDGGHLGAELLLQLGERDPGVLDGVVQQGGGDGGVVQAEVGGDLGHGDGVGDVGVARLALLALVGLGRSSVGPDHEVTAGPGVVLPEGLDDRRHLLVGGQLGPPPGQDAVDGGGHVSSRTRARTWSLPSRLRPSRASSSMRKP